MFQWWRRPEASRSNRSTSNTAQPFPQHLAKSTLQTLIQWCGCWWSEPCRTMEDKTGRNSALAKASLQLGILARSYQRLSDIHHYQRRQKNVTWHCLAMQKEHQCQQAWMKISMATFSPDSNAVTRTVHCSCDLIYNQYNHVYGWTYCVYLSFM